MIIFSISTQKRKVPGRYCVDKNLSDCKSLKPYLYFTLRAHFLVTCNLRSPTHRSVLLSAFQHFLVLLTEPSVIPSTGVMSCLFVCARTGRAETLHQRQAFVPVHLPPIVGNATCPSPGGFLPTIRHATQSGHLGT